LKVSGFTLKTGDSRLFSSVAFTAAAGDILCMDECAGRVLFALQPVLPHWGR
jgi:ABC-type uncharacterized transport system YnjBCD ATPase subunit